MAEPRLGLTFKDDGSIVVRTPSEEWQPLENLDDYLEQKTGVTELPDGSLVFTIQDDGRWEHALLPPAAAEVIRRYWAAQAEFRASSQQSN